MNIENKQNIIKQNSYKYGPLYYGQSIVADLKEECKNLGLTNYSKKNKQELIEMIEEYVYNNSVDNEKMRISIRLDLLQILYRRNNVILTPDDIIDMKNIYMK